MYIQGKGASNICHYSSMVKEVFFRSIRTKVTAVELCGPSAYYTSQWESRLSLFYLTYRLLHFLLLSGALLVSLLSRDEGLPGRWPIFLTNWALILYLSQAILGLHIVFKAFCADWKGEPIKFPVTLLKIYGALHSTSLVIALGVTVIYWSFVYDPEVHQLDFVNFTVHAGNSAIMILDLLLVAHPINISNVYLPPLFTLIYTIFNLIYFFCGGTDRKGNHYVYKVLDWTTPISASLFILGGMFLLVILFIIMWFLTILRRQVGIRLKVKSLRAIPQQDSSFDLPLA